MSPFGRPLAAFTVTSATALGALLRERAVPKSERPFPQNLTNAERRTVEAYLALRNQKALAHRLGLKRWTVQQQLASARVKAGAISAAEMLNLYRHATEQAA